MIKDLFQPEILGFLSHGLLITVYISVASIILSMIFGTILGVARYSNHSVFSKLAIL